MKYWIKNIFIITFCLLAWSCKNDSKTESGTQTNKNMQAKTVKKGKSLFQKNCATCHNINLRDKLTASPLGNITMFRDSIYLINVTKNFIKLVADGDKIATCQFIKYNKCVMTTFEGRLEDKEIVEIYRFITEESKRLKITNEEMKETYECN